jgi:hypothetical protein
MGCGEPAMHFIPCSGTILSSKLAFDVSKINK